MEDTTHDLQKEVVELKKHITLLEKHIMDNENKFLNMQEQFQREREYNLDLTNIFMSLGQDSAFLCILKFEMVLKYGRFLEMMKCCSNQKMLLL